MSCEPPTNPDQAKASETTIHVAGVGLITPLGDSAWATYRALCSGKTLSARAEQLDPGQDPVAFARGVGAVARVMHSGGDPACALAEVAAREACFEANQSLQGLPCWLGTSKGAVASLPTRMDRLTEAQAQAVVMGPHGLLSATLHSRLGVELRGHVVAACASSLTALHEARRAMLQPDGPDAALVVTSEAALTPAFLHSYRRLGVLAPTEPGRYRQAPLDESRAGFILTQCGAAVLLQKQPSSLREPQASARRYPSLLDTAIGAEAEDLIRPSVTMSTLRRLLDQLESTAQQRPGAPRVWHPHAPGTADHDPAELQAFASVADRTHGPAQVYAAKGAVGHSLGAAGLTALVLACLSQRAGLLPPMPWLTQPWPADPRCVTLSASASRCPDGALHTVTASGFGGHVAAALLG